MVCTSLSEYAWCCFLNHAVGFFHDHIGQKNIVLFQITLVDVTHGLYLSKIVFTLPAQLPTLLEIYNSQGQKVKTLTKGIVPRGKHEVLFDGTNLSSGVYIYKLRAGRHYSDSKKLILTK